ncbi:hypothetical protein FACS1894141_0090 [Spirochaetia bacterium]|nr:hypothetical protein FACS1894141_0090 [Spirochaetia bacterium]
MPERGIIRAIAGDRVTLGRGAMDACFGCMNQDCRSRGDVFTALNRDGLPLTVGQHVEIESPRRSTIIQGLIAFLPPLLGFIGGYFLTGRWVPQAGDPAKAAGGAIALFAAAGIVYLVRKRFPSQAIPRIVRVIPQVSSSRP